MKHLGTLLMGGIFLFWGSMNVLVVLRQRELAELDQYRAGVTSFLGTDLFRERWLAIYKKQKKVGYSGYTFEKVFALEGIEVHSNVEAAMEFDLLDRAQRLKVKGSLVADEAMKPLSLQLDVAFEGDGPFTVHGKRQEGKFVVTVRRGALQFLTLDLPLMELHLGDGLVPTLPVSGFKVGEEFEIPCFDPLTLTRSAAKVKVVATETTAVAGLQADVYCLETSFRSMQAKSWVTAGGELIRHELGPPFADVVLRRESRENARRGYAR